MLIKFSLLALSTCSLTLTHDPALSLSVDYPRRITARYHPLLIKYALWIRRVIEPIVCQLHTFNNHCRSGIMALIRNRYVNMRYVHTLR